MGKRGIVTVVAAVTATVLCVSCGGKKSSEKVNNEISDLQQVSVVKKSHKWFGFSQDAMTEIDLPQNAPIVMEQPWTEAVRISSAGCVPASASNSEYDAYALVNRLGLLGFSGENMHLFSDSSVFQTQTADSLVFSEGTPVFYLYKSSFFNKNEKAEDNRCFLYDMIPSSGTFYPLVSYDNLKLSNDEEMVGFFWDGDTWTCAAKRILDSEIEFKYFTWQPLIDLTELSPALSSDGYIFKPATEDVFKTINMPRLFSQASDELKALVFSIPDDFSFYVTWRDTSGTSPVSYYQAGSVSSTMNAKGCCDSRSGYSVIVFSDGTTYIKHGNDGVSALRLPLLPAGYAYGEVAVSDGWLYVSWEENNFYKTKRAGFIQINIADVLKKIKK